MKCDRNNVDIWKNNFLRRFSTVAAGVVTTNFASIYTLAAQIQAEAGELISVNVIQEAGGGGGQGLITGNKMEMLQAIEELAMTDPNSPTNPLNSPPAPRVWETDYRFATP